MAALSRVFGLRMCWSHRLTSSVVSPFFIICNICNNHIYQMFLILTTTCITVLQYPVISKDKSLQSTLQLELGQVGNMWQQLRGFRWLTKPSCCRFPPPMPPRNSKGAIIGHVWQHNAMNQKWMQVKFSLWFSTFCVIGRQPNRDILPRSNHIFSALHGMPARTSVRLSVKCVHCDKMEDLCPDFFYHKKDYLA